ncbi:MAG: hypothetical protein V1898_00305 [Patescibacteria group bacterium]
MILKVVEFLLDPRVSEMPSSDPEIRNGALLEAQKDMPEIGTRKGDRFPIAWDGQHVRGGHLDGPSWSVASITAEIKEKGWWKIVAQLDELLQTNGEQ